MYKKPSEKLWQGRSSTQALYLHEKVQCIALDKMAGESFPNAMALLGYACDEGVQRNQGRIGAKEGPDAIRRALGKLPNHLNDEFPVLDVGTITCNQGKMESAQHELQGSIDQLLQKGVFPIVLGGGHDMAYGHFKGIQSYLSSQNEKRQVGIINFDAHFDLRSNAYGNTSGTPFYQIANECDHPEDFKYLCLGIREDANDRILFQSAQELNVKYLTKDTFQIRYAEEINTWIKAFLNAVEMVYVTIDLDGFSSAFAPGVSAPSPMGFSPDIALESLKTIISSGKLISFDIAEMNPKFDSDQRTAKLAASLVHYVMHQQPIKKKSLP
ncbi:MAG: formimidoylglutamase [Bacteroidota bacterium]